MKNLCLAFIQSVFSNGCNDLRKEKSNEKLARTEEELLEHRIDAFYTITSTSVSKKFHSSTLSRYLPTTVFAFFRNFAL